MPYNRLDLMDIARHVRATYDRAVADLGADLGGGSLLDLAADNTPDVPLETLKTAIVVSGIEAHANNRIKAAIGRYSRREAR